MPIQFAGSSSTGDRRRRRLAVNGDATDVDPSLLEGDGSEIESQLVASHAAAPWVPVTELRIWIYVAMIGLLLGGLAFAHVRPLAFRAELTPLADHLFAGSRPVLLVVVQTVFLTLSAQLGLLIGWYRSRGRLDFGGRYRVWQWAVGLFGVVAFCAATNVHQTIGQIAGQSAGLQWRGHIVAWLLPVCAAALPISLLLDRDMRNSRSSLMTYRLSVGCWLASACLEIYQSELSSRAWFDVVRQLLPVFASAALFVGLWLHARIVAYVCPDPPELDEQSAWSLMLAAGGWIAGRMVFWRNRNAATAEAEDDDSKPKRRRKKLETEEAATKRKRKLPAKKPAAPRTRTRVKPAEDESDSTSDVSASEDLDSSGDANGYSDEPYDKPAQRETSLSYDESNHDESGNDEEQWDPEPKADRTSNLNTKSNGRITQVHQNHGSSVPAPHSRRQSPHQSAAPAEEASNPYEESSDESDEDRQFQLDSGMTADQMKGLSKRQKRDLKKQIRDQERARGR